MCDTLLAAPDVTADGSMMLAKNSDREPNEAQCVTFAPAAEHGPGETLCCTYLTIPQARRTHAVLLSRPFWMYGAEMGVNEHGVAVGNEAVFTRRKVAESGLTGMDLLRLALERSADAEEAVSVITALLEEHGQGGNCGLAHKFYYHNSFLVADGRRAYLLETADRDWAARCVSGVFAISNCLCPGDFSRKHSDFLFTSFARGKKRRELSLELLTEKEGRLMSRDLMAALRIHRGAPFLRRKGRAMDGLCLHAGGLVSTQTTGSMVAKLFPGRPPLVYLTGTSAPCLGVFKPHVVTPESRGGEPADLYGSPAARSDGSSLWWKAERMHRLAVLDYPRLTPDWIKARDKAEEEMVAGVEAAWEKGSGELKELCSRWAEELCGMQEQAAGKMAETAAAGHKPLAPLWFRMYWKKVNRAAGFTL
ncbi:MAG: carcinine hydrolase/isopenicillin-N N-acyltransferase family protein [Thermodesulfobacteriota bacterium]